MFCPACGVEKDKSVGKICLDCFVSDKELIKVPDYLDVEYCVKCHSFKENGEWRDPEELENSKIEAAESAVMSSLGLHKEVEEPRITLEPDLSGDQIGFYIEVFGKIRDEPVLLNSSTEVRLDKTTCNRCGKISGGYFESIIQVRAEDRDLSSSEIRDIRGLVSDLSGDKEHNKRMSFIGDLKEVDGGLDIFASTTELGQKIARSIKSNFGGGFSVSSSLIGMQDGQEVRRVTYSVRLPSFSVGDIIRVDDDLIGVEEVGDVIKGVVLNNEESFQRDWKYLKKSEIEKIGDKEELEKATISLVSGDEVQVIEPWGYENIILEKPSFLDKEKEGDEVSILKKERNYYLLPKEFSEK